MFNSYVKLPEGRSFPNGAWRHGMGNGPNDPNDPTPGDNSGDGGNTGDFLRGGEWKFG